MIKLVFRYFLIVLKKPCCLQCSAVLQCCVQGQHLMSEWTEMNETCDWVVEILFPMNVAKSFFMKHKRVGHKVKNKASHRLALSQVSGANGPNFLVVKSSFWSNVLNIISKFWVPWNSLRSYQYRKPDLGLLCNTPHNLFGDLKFRSCGFEISAWVSHFFVS